MFSITTVNVGMPVLFKAFVVVMLGGLGNVMGAVAGGLLLGVMEALVAGYWNPSYVEVFSFGLIIALIMFRPAGLFGRTMKV